MDHNLPRVSHRPFGIEHPYQQEPDERFPRYPMEGCAVAIGVRTFPTGAVKKVWASIETGEGEQKVHGELKVKGGSEEEILQFATSTLRLGDVEIGDSWMIEIPPAKQGQKVKYQIFAQVEYENRIDVLSKGPWEYVPRGWRSFGRVAAVTQAPEAISIDFLNEQSGARSALNVTVIGNALKTEAAFLGFSGERSSLDPSNNLNCQLSSDGLLVSVSDGPFNLNVQRSGKTVFSMTELPEWLFEETNGAPKECKLKWDAQKDEKIVGTGERFCSIDLRGKKVDSKVYEQYKDQGVHTYLPVPFFLSSSGYACYCETKRKVQYDFGEQTQMIVAMGKSASISSWIYVNATPLENIKAFVRQVGLPVLPADWVFGHWMSSNEWNDQHKILEQLELSKRHKIPASVIVIEAWSDETTFYVWNDAEYSAKPSDEPHKLSDFNFPETGKWPDPKGMTDELHANGVKLVLWQNPILKWIGEEEHEQQKIDEAYMLDKGYYIKWPDGSPYRVRPFWFNRSLLMDFSDPQAVDWWMSKRAYLLDEIGIDGFKTDGGEHLWGDGTVFADGSYGDEGINEYPNQYVKAYYEFANAKRANNAITFSRAGFTGAQKYPCHWAGDENSTWEAFRASYNAGINANISGIPFWGWDIGGFSGEVPSAELYLRSAAMAMFSPIMQFHSEYNGHRLPLRDRTPWNIAERNDDASVLDIYRKFVDHRYSIMAYILEEARHCAATGEPMMRPLFIDHPDDATAWHVEDQYYFGRSILVAPIFTEGATHRKVYLPKGDWKDHWSGKEIQGEQWIEVDAGLDTIPAYERILE